MTEFTRDIQTLTQQAGSSPQLQTNTGSLATDVISAASFGLGLYRQNKAATALVGAKKQQVEYQTRLDEATLAYGDFQANMAAQEQTGVAARTKRTKFLNSLGDASFQTNVIGASNKLTGTDFTETESNLNKAALQRQEDAADLVVNARAGAISAGLSAVGIENLTTEQQQKLRVQGEIADSERKVRAANLSNDIQSGTYAASSSARKTAAYLSPVMADWSLGISSKLNTGVEEVGGFNSLDKEPLLALIANERTSLDAQVRQHVETAASLGITLSFEQQNAFKTSANSVLDSFESLMGQEAVTKALGSIPDRLLSQNIVKGLTSSDGKVRNAALAITLKLGGNELSGTDIANDYKILAGLATGASLPEGGDDLKDAGKITNAAFTAPANTDGTFTLEQQTFNKDLVENLLQGTPTQVKKAVKGNVYKNLITSIVQFKGKNFAVEDHADTATAIIELGARVIASASAAAQNAPKSRLVGGSYRDRQAVNTETGKNFTLDEKTLELVPVEGFIYMSDEVKNYNTYVRDSIKALEFVGGDVEAYKMDIANSILVVR
jgi:hypothetical protein